MRPQMLVVKAPMGFMKRVFEDGNGSSSTRRKPPKRQAPGADQVEAEACRSRMERPNRSQP